VTLSNLTVQKLSETQDTAEVAAGYNVEVPFKGHAEVIVTLVKTDGQWLVSDMVEGQQADAKVEVLVQDEAGVPIAGAKVTIGNAEKELIRTEMTDDAGLAVFGTVPAPDAILTTTTVTRPREGGALLPGSRTRCG